MTGRQARVLGYRMSSNSSRTYFEAIIHKVLCDGQCCGNFKSGIIDYDYNYFSLKIPNCNFNYLKLTITTTKKGRITHNYRL